MSSETAAALRRAHEEAIVALAIHPTPSMSEDAVITDDRTRGAVRQQIAAYVQHQCTDRQEPVDALR
jgi:hypothetical protein